jgi:hypothetical protein
MTPSQWEPDPGSEISITPGTDCSATTVHGTSAHWGLAQRSFCVSTPAAPVGTAAACPVPTLYYTTTRCECHWVVLVRSRYHNRLQLYVHTSLTSCIACHTRQASLGPTRQAPLAGHQFRVDTEGAEQAGKTMQGKAKQFGSKHKGDAAGHAHAHVCTHHTLGGRG